MPLQDGFVGKIILPFHLSSTTQNSAMDSRHGGDEFILYLVWAPPFLQPLYIKIISKIT